MTHIAVIGRSCSVAFYFMYDHEHCLLCYEQAKSGSKLATLQRNNRQEQK